MATQEISASFQAGIFVLKWPEDTRRTPTPKLTRLSIDTKGFYLICDDESKNEIECFDLALIHDTRTGGEVTLPQGYECISDIKFGILDVSLALKWVSIYYGHTFVPSNELRIIHFCFKTPNLAREWAEQLFRLARHSKLKSLSCLECLEKIHSKIIHGLINSDKKIPIQSLIQYFCRNTRDNSKESKIRHALEYVRITNSLIDLNEFTFERFFRIYLYLMDRREVDKLFGALGGKNRGYISLENLKEFLKNQSETRNDPFGIDYFGQKATNLIEKYSQDHREKGISYEAFLQHLLSSDNSIIDPKFHELHMDMNKPLAHYFIASSHNTYLAGSQLTGRASIEMYRQALLTGCRCIELDVLDSENDEPEIKHIYTPIRPVRFIEVIVAIREYAFKVTSYPLILSIENHCNPRAQAKMAKYFTDVFGENLLIEPLDTHPCEENYPLPSPNDLRRRILIKNKKLQSTPLSSRQKSGSVSNTSISDQSNPDTIPDEVVKRFGRRISQPQKTPREGIIFDNEDFSDDDKPNPSPFEPTIRQAKATGAMSDLVNYMVPIRFTTFASAHERNRSFEMSSFPEDKALNLVRDYAKDFLNYNQRQLSRIYPRGTRFESSNYNPYIFWPIGCQMVALNYQTLDIPMQINLALFSFNGTCGYIEKPSALCQPRSSFDPRIQTSVENTVSYQIDLKVISGQFLCQDREPTFVDLQMYGIYGQPNKRCEHRIRAKGWNGFQAIYDDSNVEFGEFSIQFPKVILPEIAALRFSVFADDGTFLGQSFIPIAYLRSGYRHVVLRNQINIPVNSSSLFIYIRKNMSMSLKDQEFADKLVQPLINESSSSSNDLSQCDDDSSNIIIRNHHHRPSTTNHDEQVRKQNSLASTDETTSFSKHVIAGSELNDKKRLCKVLSLNDIHQKEIFERNKNIQQKLRRISMDYQPQIQKEEVRFYECLKSQNSHPNGAKHRTIKDLEQSLLKLYSDKCHQQEELEQRYLNEYYKKLEKELTEDHNRQLNQIQNILKREKARVNEQIQSQIKKEANEISKTETNKEKILLLKQKSLEKHTKVCETTLQMLEDMHEQAKEILQINLQINLIQLEEEKVKEVNTCFKRYSDGFNRIQTQILHHQNAIYSSEILSERL